MQEQHAFPFLREIILFLIFSGIVDHERDLVTAKLLENEVPV